MEAIAVRKQLSMAPQYSIEKNEAMHKLRAYGSSPAHLARMANNAGRPARRRARGGPVSLKLRYVTADLKQLLYCAIGFQAQHYPAELLATQVHYQTVPVGHCLGIPVEALHGFRVKQSMPATQVKQAIDCLQT